MIHAEYERARRARFREAGLCQQCGRAPAAPDNCRCATCSRSHATDAWYLRSERRNGGLCIQCRNATGDGRSYCHVCRIKARDYQRARRGRALANNQQGGGMK